MSFDQAYLSKPFVQFFLVHADVEVVSVFIVQEQTDRYPCVTVHQSERERTIVQLILGTIIASMHACSIFPWMDGWMDG